MVDYGFYTQQYLGSLIPEKSFNEAAVRAADALARFRRVYQVRSSGTVADHMALCAMAEAVYLDARHAGGISSASVGNASVHYGAREKSLQRQLLEKAAIYLDIGRGVG